MVAELGEERAAGGLCLGSQGPATGIRFLEAAERRDEGDCCAWDFAWPWGREAEVLAQL